MSAPVGAAGAGFGVADIIALRREALAKSDALRGVSQTAPAADPKQAGFADTLGDAVKAVNDRQAAASDLAAKFERGEVNDVAQVMLARQEAGVAFEATLQVRNKLLSAYQDIMRMGV